MRQFSNFGLWVRLPWGWSARWPLRSGRPIAIRIDMDVQRGTVADGALHVQCANDLWIGSSQRPAHQHLHKLIYRNLLRRLR